MKRRRRRRTELIEFDVGIELKNLAGAEALAKEVTDPTSRNYRRYLTPRQWENRFSPSVRADREVEASLRGAGIKITKVDSRPDDDRGRRDRRTDRGLFQDDARRLRSRRRNGAPRVIPAERPDGGGAADLGRARRQRDPRQAGRPHRRRRGRPRTVGMARPRALARPRLAAGTRRRRNPAAGRLPRRRLPAPPITGSSSRAPCRPSATASRTRCRTRCAATSQRSCRAPTT